VFIGLQCLRRAAVLAAALAFSPGAHAAPDLFEGRTGCLVVIETDGRETVVAGGALADSPLPPCSTFKIWNTLIGLEEGIVADPDAPFWKWDGEERFMPEWNRDQTLRSAFTFSCVPAFQQLARDIGPERMQSWLDKLHYGNRDQAGRPDAFWLPRSGLPSILITPREQALLVRKLVDGGFPVRESTVATLSDLMRFEPVANGVLHGKTGSGNGVSITPEAKPADIGWFVGFLEEDGRKRAFACIVSGEGVAGKTAREAAARFFKTEAAP
jgi:beta-lactamase class D